MQRVSPRASLIGLTLGGGLIAAMLIVFMLTMGGQGTTPKAFAVVTPNTATATPTCGAPTPTPVFPNPCQPKVTPLPTMNKTTTPTPVPTADMDATGNVSGVYDLRVGGGINGTAAVYSCIIRQDEASDRSVKSSSTCFVELGGSGIGDVNAEPPPGVALPQPQSGNNVAGPPPPPTYSPIVPSKGYGYVQADGTLVTYTCLANIGATPYNTAALGPYLIAKLVIPHFYGQLSTLGEARVIPGAQADKGLFLGTGFKQKSTDECNSVANGAFSVDTSANITASPITLYPAQKDDPRCNKRPAGLGADAPAGCHLAPWRVAGDVLHGYPNWDGDSCSDADELFANKAGTSTKCGDDPWSPLDGVDASDTNNIAGIYALEVDIARQDITGGTTIVPGDYITCAAYIQKGLSGGAQSVQARLLCNRDTTTKQVNPNYPGTCATSNLCADGSPGAAPPGCNDLPAECAAASPDTAHGGTCTSALGFPPYNEPPCFDLADLTTVEWLFPPVGKPGDTYPQPVAKQTSLTGGVSGNTLTLGGCFADYNGTAVDGDSYWSLKANVHTGVGVVSMWNNLTATAGVAITGIAQDATGLATVTAAAHGLTSGSIVTISGATPLKYNGTFVVTVTGAGTFTYQLAAKLADAATVVGSYTVKCKNSTPGGAPTHNAVPLQFTRETADTCTANFAVCQPVTIASDCTSGTAPCGYNTAKWDTDGDTCPDAWELSDVTNVPFVKAGLRNPQNRWDYPDVNHDGILDIGDVSDVVQKYFIDQGYVVLSGGVNSITRLIASGSVSSITRVGSTATVTTAAAHGLPLGTGSWVRVAGASPGGYNGPKAVNVTDATHFTYLVAGTLTTPATGTITWQNRTGTVTTAAAHTLTSGTIVTLAGATQAQYNGLYPITATGGSTFTYAVTGTTAAVPVTPATGTITWATGGGGGTDNLPAGYVIDTDRTGLAGSEDWELNSPDGYVTIDDVVDSVNAYGHDCPPSGAGNLPAPNAG